MSSIQKESWSQSGPLLPFLLEIWNLEELYKNVDVYLFIFLLWVLIASPM